MHSWFRTGLLLALLLAPGCSTRTNSGAGDGTAEPRRGGTLQVGLHLPLSTLDWQSSMSHPLPMVMGHVYEGLFALGRDLTAQPDLVDEYAVSEDGRSWTFGLRAGVRFHNGDSLQAGDVKASLERWRRVGPKGSGLAGLVAIETPDTRTVVLRFDRPMGQFLLLLLGSDENKAVIMPAEVADASRTPGLLTEVVGTGPYRFAEYREDQFVRLERFEDYAPRTDGPNYQAGRKDAYLDEVVFWIVPEASTRVAGLESGEFDLITEVPDTEATRLRHLEGVEPIRIGPGVLLYLMFNHRQGPTANLDMRRAIQAMVDPAEITAMVVSDTSFRRVHPGFYAPESVFADAGERVTTRTAQEYLAAAGYDGQPLVIQVIATDLMQQRIAVALVEEGKRVGLNLEIRSYDLATWVAKRRDPKELNLYSSAGYWVDPSLWQPEFNGTFPSPEVGFSSTVTDRIFNELAAATDLEQRITLARHLQDAFHDEVAMVNLGFVYRLVARSDRVHDPLGNLALGNLTLHGVWLSP